MRGNFPSVFSNVYRGGSRDSLDGGGGGGGRAQLWSRNDERSAIEI